MDSNRGTCANKDETDSQPHTPVKAASSHARTEPPRLGEPQPELEASAHTQQTQSIPEAQPQTKAEPQTQPLTHLVDPPTPTTESASLAGDFPTPQRHIDPYCSIFASPLGTHTPILQATFSSTRPTVSLSTSRGIPLHHLATPESAIGSTNPRSGSYFDPVCLSPFHSPHNSLHEHENTQGEPHLSNFTHMSSRQISSLATELPGRAPSAPDINKPRGSYGSLLPIHRELEFMEPSASEQHQPTVNPNEVTKVTPTSNHTSTRNSTPGLSTSSFSNYDIHPEQGIRPFYETSTPRSNLSQKPGVRCCNCRNTRCLKLYCECFANGSYCQGCSCVNCFNNPENGAERAKAISQLLDKRPDAFTPKIQNSLGNTRHHRGCNCKKSGCQKKYCECYQAGVPCSYHCKCHNCKNTEGHVHDSTSYTESDSSTRAKYSRSFRGTGKKQTPESASSYASMTTQGRYPPAPTEKTFAIHGFLSPRIDQICRGYLHKALSQYASLKQSYSNHGRSANSGTSNQEDEYKIAGTIRSGVQATLLSSINETLEGILVSLTGMKNEYGDTDHVTTRDTYDDPAGHS